ncbi:Telomere repeat-binding factor 4 [Linum perenne]
MDGDITLWMLEFLLRECTNGDLVTRMLTNVRFRLPADDNSRFKKTLVLRSIQDQLGKGSVSEDILGWLEYIEEIDRRDGIAVLESMKLAYCAVAVECTLRHGLKETVDRIWKVRIQRLVGKSELVTGEVPMLRPSVEMALRDLNAHMAVHKWRKKHNALKLVQDYLNEAFEIMGPSFLQLVARQQLETERGNGIVNRKERVCNDADRIRPECEVLPNMNGNCDKHGEGSVGLLGGRGSVEEHLCDVVGGGGTNGSHDVDGSRPQRKDKLNRMKRKDINTDIRERSNGKVASSVIRGEQVCDGFGREPMEFLEAGDGPEDEDTVKKRESKKKRRKGSTAFDKRKHVSRYHGPVKIADVGEFDENGDLVVESRGEENLGASTSVTSNQGGYVAQGGKDVDSPKYQLPTSLASEAGNTEPVLDKQNVKDVDAEANQSVNDKAEVSAFAAENRQNAKDVDAKATQNVNDIAEISPSASKNRPHLETRRRLPANPLKKYEDLKLPVKRKRRKWSLEEETALINGVQQFGHGCWKEILNFRRDQFDNRTEVDLKDKWRNMTKYTR